MKVVHIVAGNLDGGAARGAYWLHTGLLKFGIDTHILTDSEMTYGDPNIHSVTKTKKNKLIKIFRENVDYLYTLPYRKRSKDLFSTGLWGINLKKQEIIRNADIVHLHWINSGFVNIKHLKNISIPVVWTIRDMWPMTGGCHIAEALDCDYYKEQCGCCKQLGSSRKNDLSRKVFNRKKKYFGNNIHPVGISNWISDKVKESALLGSRKVRMISNNVDAVIFKPIDKNQARELLGISTGKNIIACGATRLDLTYKGFYKYLEALKFLDRDEFLLVFFGKLDEKVIKSLDFEYRNFGILHDNISLRLLYSAADIFIAPSIMEPFGKTLAESMACETPVVCFDATGPKDIVDHKINGYRAEAFNPNDLASGIMWITENNTNNHLGKAGREKVLNEFNSDVIAQKYINLYKELLNERTV